MLVQLRCLAIGVERLVVVAMAFTALTVTSCARQETGQATGQAQPAAGKEKAAEAQPASIAPPMKDAPAREAPAGETEEVGQSDVVSAEPEAESTKPDTTATPETKPLPKEEDTVSAAEQEEAGDTAKAVEKELPEPPALMSEEERTAELVAGNVGKSKKLNTEGYRARKKGDNAGALDAYRQAVDAAPAYGRARLNYACELSLAGRVDEAMAQLTWLYRTGREEDLDLLAAASSDPDLWATWGRSDFQALVEGVRTRRSFKADSVESGGCFGYSPRTGAVVCGYISETSEWAPVAGAALFGNETTSFQLRDDEETEGLGAELEKAAAAAGIAPVKLPHFKLKEDQEQPLGSTGYLAKWGSTQEGTKVTVKAAHPADGKGATREATLTLDDETLEHSGQPVSVSSPNSVTLWLVPGFDRFVVEAVTRTEAMVEDGMEVQGAEEVSAVGLLSL